VFPPHPKTKGEKLLNGGGRYVRGSDYRLHSSAHYRSRPNGCAAASSANAYATTALLSAILRHVVLMEMQGNLFLQR